MGLQVLLGKALADLTAFLPKLVPALVILVLGVVLAWLTRLLVSWFVGRFEPQAGQFAGKATYVAILLGAALLALGVAGVHVAALATLLGALGLAASLSLQDVARNVVAGLYLLLERPFESGDEISIQSFSGKVVAIDLRTTTLEAADGQQVLVPNNLIMSQIVLKQASQDLQPPPDRGDP
jgi:small-conductance mechanosensitive channel